MPIPNDKTGTVDVVWAHSIHIPGLASLLDAREQERLGKLRLAKDRDRFVASHALLRVVVAEWIGGSAAQLVFESKCSTCGGPHGKPGLVLTDRSRAVHVNLAHAGERVLVAVTDVGLVGVDVEELSATGFSGFDDLALAPSERAAVHRLRAEFRSSARATAWVRKEASLKATGHGLTVSPAAVVVSGSVGRPRVVSWEGPDALDAPLHLADLSIGPKYAGCVAILARQKPRVRLRSGDLLLGSR